MRHLYLLITLPLLANCAEAGTKQDMIDALKRYGSSQSAGAALSQSEIVSGLREALRQGTKSAITQLGRSDGFWKDAQAKIPLPGFIAKAESGIRMFGYGSTLDSFHLTLNRAAEQAVPQVADIFGNAIGQMTLADAQAILNGPKDAATQYFRKTSSTPLYDKILPIVQSSTAKVGVTQQYKALAAKAGPALQLAGKNNVDLDAYVTQKAMDGLFLKIADEEARIRENPAARGTELLKKVFGSRS